MTPSSPTPRWSEAQPPPLQSPASRPNPARGVLRLFRIILGVMVFCAAALTLNLTCRVGYLWSCRDCFQSATLEVDRFYPTVNREPSLVGHVFPPGQEVALKMLPYDFLVFSSPSAVTGDYITPEQARGRRYPVWFDTTHTGWSDDSRLEYQRTWPTLPSAWTLAKMCAVQLALFGLSALLAIPPLRDAARRSRAGRGTRSA